MGLENLYLYLMPQSRPVFPTSRLLVSPNSMVRPRRCRGGDLAFCFGLLYVAFLNLCLIHSAALKNMASFSIPTYGYMLFKGPFLPFLHPRPFLQYRLRVKLQCLNYCVLRLLRVCDSFIDHETSCDIKSANQWLAFCLFLLWGFLWSWFSLS